MTHQFYLIAFALLTLGSALPSCKQPSELEETSLSVSSETLSFGKDAAEQSISIQTSASSWSYLSPQEFSWFTLHSQGDQLRVSVTANTLATERTGVIAITSGGQQRRIIVRQAAGDFLLDTEATQLSFEQAGGSKSISYRSNASNVTAELSDGADWISLEQHSSSIKITVKPNEGKHKRQAKLNLLVGSIIRELTIEQQGTLNYMLPTLQFPASAAEVIRFEQARGSLLVQTPIEALQINSYRFLTNNPILPVIEYRYQAEGSQSFYSAILASTQVALFRDNPDFASYLAEQGFQKVSESSNDTEQRQTYARTGSPYELDVLFGEGGVGLELRYAGIQDKAYSTFTSLPMKLQVSRVGSPKMKLKGQTRAAIKSYEEAQQSTLDAALGVSSYDRYYVAEGKDIDGEYIRGYFFTEASKEVPVGSPYIDLLEGAQAIYKNPSLAFYEDAFGEPHLTREVIKLFADAGYAYLRKLNNGRELFYSSRDKVAYLLRAAQIDEEDVLEIQALRIDLGKPSSITRFLDQKLHLYDLQRQGGLLDRFQTYTRRQH